MTQVGCARRLPRAGSRLCGSLPFDQHTQHNTNLSLTIKNSVLRSSAAYPSYAADKTQSLDECSGCLLTTVQLDASAVRELHSQHLISLVLLPNRLPVADELRPPACAEKRCGVMEVDGGPAGGAANDPSHGPKSAQCRARAPYSACCG